MPLERFPEALDIGPAPDLTDPKSISFWIQQWMKRSRHMAAPLFNPSAEWEVDDEGLVHVRGDVNFAGLNDASYKQFAHRIPLNFANVEGSFFVTADWVESFAGFPRVVRGTLNLSGSSITSWEGAPRIVEHVTLNQGLLYSLDVEHAKRVHVQHLNLGFVDQPVCIPKFMFFPNLEQIRVQGAVADHVIDVIIDYANHLLKTCKDTPRKKALLLQQELIDNGFEEWAEL